MTARARQGSLFDQPGLTPRPLPVAWDGVAVTWTGFETPMPMFLCGRFFRDLNRCSVCGSDKEPSMAWGRTEHQIAGVPHIGRGPRTTRLIRVLVAYRCPDCFHDVVQDRDNDTWWDLGPEDYGPDGSVAP